MNANRRQSMPPRDHWVPRLRWSELPVPIFILVPVLLAWSVAIGPSTALALPAAETGPSATSTADPAGAPDEQTYTYWSFWTAGATGDWTASNDGPATSTPADGTSQGWRFGVGATPTYTEAPRVAPDFQLICGDTPVAVDRKRVAVVIDSGTPAEAPTGDSPPGVVARCASVAPSANNLQTLTAVASVRQSADSMICGINGYPRSGCGAQVSLAAITASPNANSALASDSVAGLANTDSVNSLPLLVGAITLAGLIIGAVLLSRRRPV